VASALTALTYDFHFGGVTSVLTYGFDFHREQAIAIIFDVFQLKTHTSKS